MYQIDFEKPINIHFIGIGGISMSGLAEILITKGFKVSGSDNKESELTKSLSEAGATVYIGQRADNIREDVDLVVYTAAIRGDNPEYAEVVNKGIPMLTRAELLGQLMRNYETPVAISGTHGKTTTTSMLSMILMQAELDPTISVGGILKEIGGNIRIGETGYFITEACEYTNSFLSFFPKMACILNIEADHLDFFKDLEDIYSSFRRFAELIPKDGILVINQDIADLGKITDGLKCKVITFSISDDTADYYAKDVSYNELGRAGFTAVGLKGEEQYELSVFGEHNIANALASIALSESLNIPYASIKEGLESFRGTDRRFQLKGNLGGVTIVDDYAHHPTEITATLKAAHNYPSDRIVCVFQPHTYSRTKAFFHEFADALCNADLVVLADIYAAREKDTLGVSSEDLMEEIREKGTECYYFPSFDEIENFLLQNCIHGDLLITMGAGDIVKVGENLLGE